MKAIRVINPPHPPVLLFDGVCNLCNRLIQFIIKRDPSGKFMFAPLQSESGRAILEKFDLPNDQLETFVYVKAEMAYLKSSAVLHVLKDLGGGWQYLYILMIVPKSIRDFIYKLVSKTRYNIFGKSDQCMVPTEDLKGRFLH